MKRVDVLSTKPDGAPAAGSRGYGSRALSFRPASGLGHEASSNLRGRQAEVWKQLMPFATRLVDRHLKPVAESWQPSDFLPDASTQRWHDEVEALRTSASQLPDELLVALVGNLVTEEALPSYESELVRCEGMPDFSDRPLTNWIKGWTAEENRHGDLLNRYLYLSGRVNMRSVELTIQHLLRNGFFPNAGNDQYRSLIYTTFQERATKIAHGNCARIAARHGNPLLARICGAITGDEGRHESFYKELVRGIFQHDPEEAVLTLQHLMRRPVTMPGRLMDDGETEDLFSRYAAVAQRIGVYCAKDYADIFQHLMAFWEVPAIRGLRGRAARAQERLCDLSGRIHELAERAVDDLGTDEVPMPWIFHRKV